MIPDCFTYDIAPKKSSVVPQFSPFIFSPHDEDPSENIRVSPKVFGGLYRSICYMIARRVGLINSPECRIRSAPHLKGYCRGGGANVESIPSRPPTACTFLAYFSIFLISQALEYTMAVKKCNLLHLASWIQWTLQPHNVPFAVVVIKIN